MKKMLMMMMIVNYELSDIHFSSSVIKVMVTTCKNDYKMSFILNYMTTYRFINVCRPKFK